MDFIPCCLIEQFMSSTRNQMQGHISKASCQVGSIDFVDTFAKITDRIVISTDNEKWQLIRDASHLCSIIGICDSGKQVNKKLGRAYKATVWIIDILLHFFGISAKPVKVSN